MTKQSVALLLGEASPETNDLATALREHAGLRVERSGTLFGAAPVPSENVKYVIVTPSAYRTVRSLHPEERPLEAVVVVSLARNGLLDAGRLTIRVDAYLFIDVHRELLLPVLELARIRYSLVPSYIQPGFTVDQMRLPLLDNLGEDELITLRLLSEGLSNSAIAERMRTPESTVKSLIRAVLGKLRLRNRTEAAVFSLRHAEAIGDIDAVRPN